MSINDVDDVIRVNSDTGELIIDAPSPDWANVTANISLSCITELLGGERGFDNIERCVEIVFSILTLSKVRLYGFPLELRWPWQDDLAALTTNASLASLTPSVAEGSYAGALHVSGEAEYAHDHNDFYVYPVDLLALFVLVGFLSLLCGAGYNDYYYTDTNGRLVWNGVGYERVRPKAQEGETEA